MDNKHGQLSLSSLTSVYTLKHKKTKKTLKSKVVGGVVLVGLKTISVANWLPPVL